MLMPRARRRAFARGEVARRAMLTAGVLLIVIAPVTAPLPGPGATLLAAAGLSLVLRNSLWARRRYVRFKARWPKLGDWCDWGLRRPSHRRRTAVAKARTAQDASQAGVRTGSHIATSSDA